MRLLKTISLDRQLSTPAHAPRPKANIPVRYRTPSGSPKKVSEPPPPHDGVTRSIHFRKLATAISVHVRDVAFREPSSVTIHDRNALSKSCRRIQADSACSSSAVLGLSDFHLLTQFSNCSM